MQLPPYVTITTNYILPGVTMYHIGLYDLSVADYVAQSSKWCAEFNIHEEFPYDLKVELADYALYGAGFDKLSEIEQEAEGWLEEERLRRQEARPKFNSMADYISQTERWSSEFSIPKYLPYTEKVRMAEEVVRTLDRTRYADLVSAAETWAVTQTSGEEPFDHWKEQIRRQLLQIQTGKYLMIYLPYGSNYVIKQGQLKSIDWNAGTVLLHSTTYNHEISVSIEKITSVDESRSRSGALGAVQVADLRKVGNDWYRGNTKIEY
ncbi:hypothetical protein [Pseudoduganella chitinolytica]|uniref:Uncharacterized protein n=1 Tax=Pseudoduganella chitinolytica TaxID=34070 RepID=A0ABY8BH59_9BURK|nr:hypothetical protein [Pseudoduganella chitinolytica]WEF35267.1 hypothetical protein PX653_11070 [Pseudoduganella chitinolytica]